MLSSKTSSAAQHSPQHGRPLPLVCMQPGAASLHMQNACKQQWCHRQLSVDMPHWHGYSHIMTHAHSAVAAVHIFPFQPHCTAQACTPHSRSIDQGTQHGHAAQGEAAMLPGTRAHRRTYPRVGVHVGWLHGPTRPTTTKIEHAFQNRELPTFDVPTQVQTTQKYPAGPDQKRAKQK